MPLKTSGPLANRFLASLNRRDLLRLKPSLKAISLAQGALLHEVGDEVEWVAFPYSGMVSLLAVMANGKAIEIANVGREGVVGALAGLGRHVALDRAMVQLPLVGVQIEATAFRKAAQASSTLRALILAHHQVIFAQVRTTAACNTLHSVEARLCRWLLQTRDRTGTNVIGLTQESLSQLLSVRRTSVSAVSGKGTRWHRLGPLRMLVG